LVQVDESEFERTHLGVVDPLRDQAGAKIQIGPISKKPPNPCVDLRITQLYEEGTIGTTWPWIHPHSHFSLTERFNEVADKGPQEVRAC
jgi:hypothetical protein